MTIPSVIRAGDTVVWIEDPAVNELGAPIGSSSHDLAYYLRHATAGAGLMVEGVVDGSGWKLTISASDSADMVVGDWYYQAVAVGIEDGTVRTIRTGRVVVEPSLAYTGTPAGFDGRSQAQKDLDTVQAAIRSLMSGGAVQEYRIGTRSLKRYELTDLLALETQLKAQVARERRAEMIASGLGNPHNLFVRFTR